MTTAMRTFQRMAKHTWGSRAGAKDVVCTHAGLHTCWLALQKQLPSYRACMMRECCEAVNAAWCTSGECKLVVLTLVRIHGWEMRKRERVVHIHGMWPWPWP